uniref:EF-hand domain-containing protein n=1 Tax=Haptolina ericina TaxID=156174 RepID=A0A7S3C092_9EUKA
MQDAVVSLLGALPPFEFDSQVTTTGDKMAALMLQLQMTGYMLRNAEYVLTLRKVLNLSTRTAAEYREAFDKLDLDGSGFIERNEIEKLLTDVYDGKNVPDFEVDTFIRLFDVNSDGVVSWEEFATTLGVIDLDENPPADPLGLLNLLPAGDEDAPTLSTPTLEGKVKVQLGEGEEIEVEAAAYMEELKTEAQALRRELAKVKKEEQERELALSSSISAYVGSLPESQLKVLTAGISEDVVGAMRMVVEYILKAPGGDRPLSKDESVTIEQEKLQQLCLYQLVLGYNLRESEAKGDADDMIGR